MSYRKTIVVGFTLFGLVILVALSTFYVSLGTCPSGSMSCDNGTKCVPQKLICNFIKDCQDGEDESSALCSILFGSGDVVSRSINESNTKHKSNLKKHNVSEDKYEGKCIYESNEIADNCKCYKLDLVACFGIEEIPRKFPNNVVMIHLKNNRIKLKDSDSFQPFSSLTYLNLGCNNISFIPSKILHDAKKLRKLYLNHNEIRTLPHDMFATLDHLWWLFLENNKIVDFDLHLLTKLYHLEWLDMSYNQLTLNNASFPRLRLKDLFLDGNKIATLNDNLFINLHNLTLISLRFNSIASINSNTFFNHLLKLREIRLSDNPIHTIGSDLFYKLPKLNALYLDNVRFRISSELVAHLNVSFLSIQGISYEQIDFNGISQMNKLKYIVYEKFFYCSMTPHVRTCKPNTDGVSSSTDLLTNATLRYAAWLMALLTCVGNLMVLWGRFTSRDENRSVNIVIRNLAVADLMMAFYLVLIGFQDFKYRGFYRQYANDWLNSWKCAAAGILAMISCEVSIIILTFMSIERFLLISDPFGHHRLNTKNIMMSMYVIWLSGIFIAIFPVILFWSSTKFYGVYSGSVCFPLYIQERYSIGWEYSAFVFLGINFTLLIIIATLYTTLLFSIWRTRRATTCDFLFECEFAVRFFFIVLTDLTCWLPVIYFKLMALIDVEVSGDVHAFLVIFVLPLNAFVNPWLYTFSTPKYRDRILSKFNRGSFSKKLESNSNQVTADDSQTKTMLCNSNSIFQNVKK